MKQLIAKVEELRQLNDTLAGNMETDGSTWTSLIDQVKTTKVSKEFISEHK